MRPERTWSASCGVGNDHQPAAIFPNGYHAVRPTPHSATSTAATTEPMQATPTTTLGNDSKSSVPWNTGPAQNAEYTAAAAKVDQQGFRPGVISGTPGPGAFFAVLGTTKGAADSGAYQVFFFFGSTYLGTDTSEPSTRSALAWNGSNTIAVEYTLYRTMDAHCCPTGGGVTVRYQWDGTRVTALDPIPSRDTDPHR